MKNENVKKIIYGILLFCVVLAVCIYRRISFIQPQDYIAPKILSEQQKQICDLISTDKHKMLIYDFKTKDTYKNVEFWVETYKDGKLVDSRVADNKSSYVDAKILSGEFAVIINRTPDYQWSLVYAENGGTKVDTTSSPNANYNMICDACCSINQPVEIEDGREIILYACVFGRENNIETFDIQNLSDVNNLKRYEYAHLIKCKFSK